MTTRLRVLGFALAPVAAAVPLLVLAACGGDDDDGGGSVDDAAISEVRDALDGEVRTTLATMLFENPGSHDYLLGQAERNDPDVWEEINADGEITLDEFRSIPDVQNAVNHYGGDVTQFFQDQMVAAQG
jgi:hypothetical protein